MFKVFMWLSVIAICCAQLNCQADEKAEKPGIILVAFGTSVPEARKVFYYMDSSAKKKFPGYDIVWGFTARSIVKKLREEGTDKGVMTLEEAVDYMKKKGYKTVVLQSMHVVPGQKDAELKKVDTKGMAVVLGKPLLSDAADMDSLLNAVEPNMKKGEPNVFCGHGNDHHPEYNKFLNELSKKISARFAESWLCTVEGTPGADALAGPVKQAVAKSGGKINFIPLMIVAGDHIMNDVSGAEDDSWKNIVAAKEITVAKPLGYNDAVLAVYWKHLADAINTVK